MLRRKSSKVSSPQRPGKREPGVRVYHKVVESTLPAHTRRGLRDMPWLTYRPSVAMIRSHLLSTWWSGDHYKQPMTLTVTRIIYLFGQKKASQCIYARNTATYVAVLWCNKHIYPFLPCRVYIMYVYYTYMIYTRHGKIGYICYICVLYIYTSLQRSFFYVCMYI